MDRLSNQARILVIVLVVVALGVVLLGSLRHDRPPAATDETNLNLLMGNPSGATADPDHPDNFLMRKPYFVLAYNNARGTPNWVSWALQKSDLGNAPRDQFYPDPELPRTFKHVTLKDYSGSGFDRGHMCPHSDRAATAEASRATFVMTNIIPQSPSCNQKAWADLEDYCRSLARRGNVLYIVAGPQGQGGAGTAGEKDTIAGGKVTVPAKCWKVILVLKGGTGTAEDLGRVGRDARLIAVVMPNDQSVDHGWAKYRTSVKDVETLTGYRFFDRVPADVIEPLKDRVDAEHVPHGGHHKRED